MLALRVQLFGLVVAIGLGLNSSALAAPAWHPVDTAELERVRTETPQAAELFEKAEASLRSGDLKAAEPLLREARAVQPNSFLLGRRHCQVLTELGQQADAIEACSVSNTMGTAMDARAFVGALMAGSALPKPRELVQAVRQATAARRLQNQPFSEAALCDVAYKIGDEALLDSCVDALQTTAPGNFETKRWQSVRQRTPAWALWLGWLSILSAALVTLGHALYRWLGKPNKPAATSVAATTLLILSFGFAAPARAQDQPSTAAAEHPEHWQLSQFRINWENPESQIPSIEERNKSPLQFGYFLQDLNVEALKAERKGDWRTALKFWRADAKAVPDMAVGFSKSCRAYQMLGEIDHAIEFCSKALNLEGSTVEDYLRLAELVTGKSGSLSVLEIQDLDAMVAHLRQTEQAAPAAVVECRTGVKLDDAVRLQRCTDVLAKTSPHDPRTLTFQWSYAMLRKDYAEAKRLLAAMAQTDMNRQALSTAQEATARASAWWRRPLTDWRYALGLGLVIGLAVTAFLLNRRRTARPELAHRTSSAPAVSSQ